MMRSLGDDAFSGWDAFGFGHGSAGASPSRFWE